MYQYIGQCFAIEEDRKHGGKYCILKDCVTGEYEAIKEQNYTVVDGTRLARCVGNCENHVLHLYQLGLLQCICLDGENLCKDDDTSRFLKELTEQIQGYEKKDLARLKLTGSTVGAEIYNLAQRIAKQYGIEEDIQFEALGQNVHKLGIWLVMLENCSTQVKFWENANGTLGADLRDSAMKCKELVDIYNDTLCVSIYHEGQLWGRKYPTKVHPIFNSLYTFEDFLRIVKQRLEDEYISLDEVKIGFCVKNIEFTNDDIFVPVKEWPLQITYGEQQTRKVTGINPKSCMVSIPVIQYQDKIVLYNHSTDYVLGTLWFEKCDLRWFDWLDDRILEV
jgi:hypothetical protein